MRIDGPFILGLAIDKPAIFGYDCEKDKNFTWNIKKILDENEVP
jgi:hypothetical protein